ncbi:MAG: site-2 protease family protein [Bacteroidetes bacterium]|nr:site-2 protease family protein [Bacteroidota bacterium]
MTPPASYLPPNRYLLHTGLFLVTLLSTSITGAVVFIGRTIAWSASDPLFSVGGLPVTTAFLADAFMFGVAFLTFVTVHEFGHFIAARRHQINCSLPYFIPSPLIGVGTLGAVISIRQPIPNLKKLFDVGVSGPIAGFLIVIILLIWAMVNLPPPEFMYGVGGHESIIEYIRSTGQFPDAPISDESDGSQFILGMTPLYWMLTQFSTNVPPLFEMYHYPLLFACWLGLFFTSLNLMPVGQLDGGHIIYSLFGPKWHSIISRAFVFVLLLSMTSGGAFILPDFLSAVLDHQTLGPISAWITLAALLVLLTQRAFGLLWWKFTLAILFIASFALIIPSAFRWFAYFGWLPWCFLIIFLIKVDHPHVPLTHPLGSKRRLIGYLTLGIFFLCFSIKPLYTI